MKNNSLNYQFKKQLALSIGFLVIVFSFLIYKLFYTGMGSATQRTLMAMAKHYANVAEQSPESPLPKGDLYSVYIGKDSIPENIASKTDIDQLTDYKMRVFDDERIVKIGPPKQVMFILAYPLKKSDEKLFLVYREEGRPFRDRNAFQPPPPRIFAKINIPMSIGLITLLALALFFGLARSLIQKVLNPLKELAVMANSLDENKPELSFDVMKDKTEIGVVANTLHQTMARIHEYHQREKQFLQNASHELRTPIAVVASALDIIDLRNQNGTQKITDQITHIKRANENMKELTEALLLLSRENEKDYPIEFVDLNKIVTTVVKTHQYLIDDKFIEVSIINDENSSYELPLTLCQIVLSNLIRNAFEHTLSGIVRIRVVDASVIISNSIESHIVVEEKQLERGFTRGDGYGIGLSIVSKIVKRQQWQLKYAQTSDGYNQVTVTFK